VTDALHQTLADVADLLGEKNIPFVVIEGIAVSVRGEPRFTADVDAVLGADVDRALALIREFDGTPFRPLFADVDDVVRTTFLLPLRHRGTSVKVDLAIGLSGFERQAIHRATLVDLAGCAVPIATSEDLILMKVLAVRPRDMADAQGIVARHKERLDWDYLLTTGRDLQEAAGVDIVAPLQEFRRA
jgi:hypothetical protein